MPTHHTDRECFSSWSSKRPKTETHTHKTITMVFKKRFLLRVVALVACLVTTASAFCPVVPCLYRTGIIDGTGTDALSLPPLQRLQLPHCLQPLSPRQGRKPLQVSLGSPESSPPEKPNTPAALTERFSFPLVALALMAFVVLFHESGHYLTAKSIGVPVDEFSVGFGPKLWGFQAFGKEHFNLRAIPFGGFVTINHAALAVLPWWPRIQILIAGPLFNLLLATLIYTYQIMFGNGLSVPVFDAGVVVGVRPLLMS